MVKINVVWHCSKKPLWALILLATLPFDRNKDYPEKERYAIMGNLLDYLDTFTYKKRNAVQQLGVTHNLRCRDLSITVETVSGNPVLTIYLTKVD